MKQTKIWHHNYNGKTYLFLSSLTLLGTTYLNNYYNYESLSVSFSLGGIIWVVCSKTQEFANILYSDREAKVMILRSIQTYLDQPAVLVYCVSEDDQLDTELWQREFFYQHREVLLPRTAKLQPNDLTTLINLDRIQLRSTRLNSVM